MSDTPRTKHRRHKHPFLPPHSGVTFQFSAKFDIDELSKRLSRFQLSALMQGVAQVLAAGKVR